MEDLAEAVNDSLPRSGIASVSYEGGVFLSLMSAPNFSSGARLQFDSQSVREESWITWKKSKQSFRKQ